MGIRHVGVKSGIHLTYRAALVGKDDHIVVTKIADRIAVGSSGGSAVAVSSNMVPLTFGSETDGSIIGPAQINSVVGIKPTPGLTSRSGIIPSSYSLDTVGPLGRSVQDAVLGLNAIVGSDERDPLTLGKARHQDIDYTQFLRNQSSLRGAKFGLPIKRCWEFVKADQKREATRILDGIVEAGGEIIHLDYQCAEERIASNGKWDWYVNSALYGLLHPLITIQGSWEDPQRVNSRLSLRKHTMVSKTIFLNYQIPTSRHLRTLSRSMSRTGAPKERFLVITLLFQPDR